MPRLLNDYSCADLGFDSCHKMTLPDHVCGPKVFFSCLKL